MSSALLEVHGVKAAYGKTPVLRGVDVRVAAGERIGLFGPNGHGKTTLLRLISGLLEPSTGEVRFDGEAIHGRSPREIVARGLVHVPQGSTLFPRLTVIENLRLGAFSEAAWDAREDSLAHVFDVFPKLRERREQFARTLSGGERQMVAVGMGLMARPRLLMLDEPTLGLAPRVKGELADAIGRVAESGVTLLVVDQDLALLGAVAQRLYLIEQGEVRLETTGDSVDESDVLAAYFGSGGVG